MRLLHAARLSRLGDASTGIEKQEEAAQRYADTHGHEIIGTARDANVSGSKDPFERPSLGEWLKRPSAYDGIIAAKLDRLGRNARHLQELRAWAEDHHKVLIVVDPALQWPVPKGVEGMPSRVMWELLGIMAEAELAAITERTAETRRYLIENEYAVGYTPWGYLSVAKDNHRTLVPDPELTPYLLGMVERAIRGDSLTSICEWLDSEGVPPRKGGALWSPGSVSQVLRNPILYGERKAKRDDGNGKRVYGRTLLKVPAVIEYGEWKRLQAVLDGKPRRGATSNDPAMLTGALFCLRPKDGERCGNVMHWRRTKKTLASGKPYIRESYRCDGTARNPSKCKNNIQADEIERFVNEQFVGTFGDREVIERVTVPGSSRDDELALVSDAIRELGEQLAAEQISDDDYDEQIRALRAERARLHDLPDEPDRVVERPTGVTVAEHWQSLDAAGRRQHLLDAGVKIYAAKHPDGFLEIDLQAETPHVLWQS